ncbi:HEAT repeat protein-like protein [Westerdykella ornata]|uniref:HEAT repeat protein-like protein n=1 Tax=Westerdykella ornata TaxID=318751 RepID=A0A6A6JMR0_WESOR|nr:HEAT repeat protein-like protein [Westerdykella ornata]KAF2277782.1 HEAT repeat protein-like protein [Westerdykella ornata]
MERKQAFLRLKPACVELLQVVSAFHHKPNAKREIVRSLERLVSTLHELSSKPGSLDAKLAEFAFVPISHVLRASKLVPVRALELCLKCTSILLRTGWDGELSPELTGQLLILFTFLANPSPSENGLPATSEDLQASAFRCMAELLTSVAQSDRGPEVLTETANIPTLGKAVLTMVDSFSEVRSQEVKKEALAALETLISCITDVDALASFLPRIVSSLTKLLTPSISNRLNFRLIERGLDILALVLQKTLSDSDAEHFPSSEGSSRVVRTIPWLHATAAQIQLALANVLRLRTHDKMEVRHALLNLCLATIRECRKSLSECSGMVIETLVTLAGRGEDPDTIETDLKVLLSLDQALASLLRESLHDWILSLPRLMQSKDDSSRRQVILQISVALRLLNSAQTDLSMIDDLLALHLRDSVSEVFKESKSIGTVAESVVQTGHAVVVGNTGSTTFQPLTLRLKGQEIMMNEFNMLLRELAKSDSALVVAQDLIDAVDFGSEDMQIATLWLSVRLLQCVSERDEAIDDFLDFGNSNPRHELLDQLYSLSIERLTASAAEGEPHWHIQALALEVVALQAQRYKIDFRVELIESLYPVLHHLGSPNPGLRAHAMTCLNIMAEACDYADASDLVVSNVDYIINAVGLKLNYHDISPQAPQVLLMMLRLSGPSLLPYLDDLVGSIFSALERYHGYPKLVELLFAVLKGMAEEGIKAPQLAVEGPAQQLSHFSKTESVADVVSALKKLKRQAQRDDEEHEKVMESFPRRPWKETPHDAENEEHMEDTSQEDNQAVQQAEPQTPAPKTFDILLKISELTQHYLTSSSPTLRSSLLSLLNTTIPALAKHENSFLPLINTLWPVLLPRLGDPEAYVVSDALSIMSMMCIHAGDFMKSRIEGCWDELKSIHKRSMTSKTAQKSTGKKTLISPSTKRESLTSDLLITQQARDASGTDTIKSYTSLDTYQPEKYIDTPTRMIRESLIRLLCSIAQYVGVREDLFDDIVDMLDPVLQRQDVKEALEVRNPDAVWLRLLRKSRLSSKGNMGGEEIVDKDCFIGRMPVGKPQWRFVMV